MEYEFMRRLTKGLPAELLEQTLTALLEQGIEVYTEADEADANANGAAGMEAGERQQEQKTSADKERLCYMAVDSAKQFRGGDIYIPAADQDRAIELLRQTEAGGYICEDPVESLQMTEAQKWEADMVRRNRRNIVICLVVIVLALIYYVLR